MSLFETAILATLRLHHTGLHQTGAKTRPPDVANAADACDMSRHAMEKLQTVKRDGATKMALCLRAEADGWAQAPRQKKIAR